MPLRKKVYLYPYTTLNKKGEGNKYIENLIKCIQDDIEVVNGKTSIGILDAFLKFRNTDVFYFNWIEDLPTKKFGVFQFFLLLNLLFLIKISNKKIIWFIHNNISHYKQYIKLKIIITKLMSYCSDIVFAHSNEVNIKVNKKKLHVYFHPFDAYDPIEINKHAEYDLIIWGTITPYKGVEKFINHVAVSNTLKNYKILIAGAFSYDDEYKSIMEHPLENVTIINKYINAQELKYYFSISRYNLFTYSSSSILSSAALCHSLSSGMNIIASNIGSFKELGAKKLIYTYETFNELEILLEELKNKEIPPIDQVKVEEFVSGYTWDGFASFVKKHINQLN
jgi:beta-1,4-mannosyltransferase